MEQTTRFKVTLTAIEAGETLSFDFNLRDALGEIIAGGTAPGWYAITDAIHEIVSDNFPEVIKGKPASFTDIAFDSGRIAERKRITDLLEPYADSCEHGSCDCLSADSTIDLINGNGDN